MVKKNSIERNIFLIFNYIFLIVASFICLFPLVHVLAISFSSSWAAAGGLVKLWPAEIL